MTDLNALVSEYYDLRRDPQALVELAHRWWSDIDRDGQRRRVFKDGDVWRIEVA